MAESREHAPSPWAKEPEIIKTLSESNEKATCVMAGASLERENQSFKRATPILYQINLSLPREAFIIPKSELGMHIDAEGKEILAFFTTTSSAYVIYDNEVGGCGYATGTVNELLTPELWDAVKDRLVGP